MVLMGNRPDSPEGMTKEKVILHGVGAGKPTELNLKSIQTAVATSSTKSGMSKPGSISRIGIIKSLLGSLRRVSVRYSGLVDGSRRNRLRVLIRRFVWQVPRRGHKLDNCWTALKVIILQKLSSGPRNHT